MIRETVAANLKPRYWRARNDMIQMDDRIETWNEGPLVIAVMYSEFCRR